MIKRFVSWVKNQFKTELTEVKKTELTPVDLMVLPVTAMVVPSAIPVIDAVVETEPVKKPRKNSKKSVQKPE